MRARFMIAAAISMAGFVAGPAMANWEELLEEQALIELGCEVAFVNEVEEREVDGQLFIFAKVHCVDERAFYADWVDEFIGFAFRPCEIEVNEC